MLKISGKLPCKLVYAFSDHPYLGSVVEPYIVQLTNNGDYSLAYQKLHAATLPDFKGFIAHDDYPIIEALEKISNEQIAKKYHKANINYKAFFEKHFTPAIEQLAKVYTQKIIAMVLPQLINKPIFYKGKDGNPAQYTITPEQGEATVVFHFIRGVDSMRYYPTIKLNGNKVEFINRNAKLLNDLPAYLLVQNTTLIKFENHVDGKKLKAFLEKRFIEVPRSAEETYFKKFLIPLIEQYHVHAEGFTIQTERFDGKPFLKLENTWNGNFQLVLYFKYGNNEFMHALGKRVSVSMQPSNDTFLFTRIKRSVEWESTKAKTLIDLGLKNTEGAAFVIDELKLIEGDTSFQKYQLLDWLGKYKQDLVEANFEVEQQINETPYLITTSTLEIKISENKDWFDVHAIVKFGDIEIPFTSLRRNILYNIREYKLPDGQIVIIPEQWFAQLKDLFNVAESQKDGSDIQLKKYHIGVLQQLQEGNIAEISINRRLQKLLDNTAIEEVDLPTIVNASLRPYQKAGFDWLCFLQNNGFGGCLADDMGLGKTLQTLCFLAKLKNDFEDNTISEATNLLKKVKTSLLIVPTSLLYNWIAEAEKFVPTLEIYLYSGADRIKNTALFDKYDLVLTSYGIMRNDIEILEKYFFNYIILDESQNIKNVSSIVTQAVFELKSHNKLLLSGTPLENSIAELWPQMHFANKGLLSNFSSFKENYVQPIEKENDEAKRNRLYALINPFLLRRTKEQVAKDLPPKVEQLIYCDMTESQTSEYEEIKSQYRNQLLSASFDGAKNTAFTLLAGLTKLRQLCNHPLLVNEAYEGDSGKYDEVCMRLESAVEEKHKVLVFSQFVKQLNLYKKYLDEKEILYYTIDGSISASERKRLVDLYQNTEEVKIFLISLKAGGVGLNLTAADYVFILDPWWNPAIEQQAIDRSHRIGQTKTVFTYKFISRNSVEEKILKLQESKKALSNSLIKTEESFFKSLSKEDISAILQ